MSMMFLWLLPGLNCHCIHVAMDGKWIDYYFFFIFWKRRKILRFTIWFMIWFISILWTIYVMILIFRTMIGHGRLRVWIAHGWALFDIIIKGKRNQFMIIVASFLISGSLDLIFLVDFDMINKKVFSMHTGMTCHSWCLFSCRNLS